MKKLVPPETGVSWTGITCGVIAALGYTSAHTFLRSLSLTTDAAWVSCVKALCTVVIFTPWLLWLASRRKFRIPQASSLIVLLLAGCFVQLAGNLLYQISLGEIGLAITVPLVLGSMIVSTAVLGRALLGEAISRRMIMALAVLILSISILSQGIQLAPDDGAPSLAQPAPRTDHQTWLTVIYCFYACLSGLSYSLLGIAIRWTTRRSPISLATPMVIVGLCGVTILGTIVIWNHGLQLVVSTESSEWQSMLLAGVSNSTAFLALTYALRVLPVIYVNAINVTQIGMAAIIGVMFFHEPATVYLILGLTLMLLGFAVMTKIRRVPNRRQPSSGRESGNRKEP